MMVFCYDRYPCIFVSASTPDRKPADQVGTTPDSDIRPVSSASDTVSAASPLIAAIRERQSSHTDDNVVSVSSPVDTAPKTDTENELTDLEDLLLPQQISTPTTVEPVKRKEQDAGQQVVPEKKDPQVKNETELSDAVTPRKEGESSLPDLKSPEVIGRLNRLKKKLKKQKMQQQAMDGMPVMSERLQAKLLGKQATQTIVEKKTVLGVWFIKLFMNVRTMHSIILKI